jgi:hypothetical protein
MVLHWRVTDGWNGLSQPQRQQALFDVVKENDVQVIFVGRQFSLQRVTKVRR